MGGPNHFVEMELREIQMKDDVVGSQVIILGEKNGERTFPIFIGYSEAFALDMTLHGFKNERPMTHDLVFNVIEGLGAELHHVLIDDLQNNTFFGKLVLQTPDGSEMLIDSRPSDAIVLAAKRKLPIFVAEVVLERIIREDEEE
jgi:bifunctional DNase/RNase